MDEIVDIFDISYDGSGVGKLSDGRIVFVPKALPCEKVCIDNVEAHSKYYLAKCQKVLQKSPERIPVKCPYFEICGGCDFQHTSKQNEQKLKTQILQRELAKVGYDGKIDFVSSERFFYRNKIKLEVKNCQIGYFLSKTHKFFRVQTCPIADKRILEAFPVIESFLKENNFDKIKNVYIKLVQNELLICFLFDKNAKIEIKNVKNLQILHDFKVFFAFGDILESDKTKVVPADGDRTYVQTLQAFNQVNDDIAAKLYSEILAGCDGKNVVNAYSGQGELTKQLSHKAKYVVGIEMQKSAHIFAEKLCKSAGNIKNYCGRVEDILPNVVKEKSFDLIVLDPAREGCKKIVLDSICQSCVKEVLYVSCNFASLVRDLKTLLNNYSIKQVKIFDMFPCTANMETMVKLSKK